jgi:hypothetical protein
MKIDKIKAIHDRGMQKLAHFSRLQLELAYERTEGVEGEGVQSAQKGAKGAN